MTVEYRFAEGTANELVLDSSDLVRHNPTLTHTGKGDLRATFAENRALNEYAQRNDRFTLYENNDPKFTGYILGAEHNEKAATTTIRADGIGLRLEETRPDYDTLGGPLVYTSIALDEAIRDYWSRTPFSATVTDQSTEIVSNDEQLQEADTNTEWNDITSFSATDPLVVRNGNLELAQTSFTQEGETPDSGSDSGSGGLQDYYSDGAAATFDGTGDISFNFTPAYDIPGEDFGFYVRINTEPGIDGTEVVFEVNGTEVDRFPQSGGIGDPGEWTDVANDPYSGSGYTGGDLAANTQHTVRIYSGTGGTDLTSIDVVAPLDTRFNYFFDNDNGGNGGFLDGPELFPSSYSLELAEQSTAFNITEGTINTTWDNTTNNQAIALSNDGGTNYASSANSSNLTVNFSGAGRTAQSKFTFSRYGSRTTATPQTGFNGQKVQDYTLTVDLNDLVVIDRLELSRNHFDNLKTLHNYGDFVWVIEHSDGAIGNLTVSSFARGEETRPSPAAFDNPANKKPEVKAENYYNSIYLEGALQPDGTRPTAEVKDQTAINNDGREISPGVLRDLSISTDAGATFRANALLQAALSNNDLVGTVRSDPEYIHPGYARKIAFAEDGTKKFKTVESVSLTQSQGSLEATFEFVVRSGFESDISELKRKSRDLENTV